MVWAWRSWWWSLFKSKLQQRKHPHWEPVENLELVEKQLFENATVENKTALGFDTEFTSSASDPNEHTLALIQVASDDCVYLLGVCYFRNANKMGMLEQLVTKIFKSSTFVVFDYAAKIDFRLLRNEFESLPDESYYFIDLEYVKKSNNLSKYLEKEKVTNSKGVKVSGLSKLCLQTLGTSLDKKEQMSDWTRSPLREKQVTYAALDAACLLKIYHKFNTKPR